MKDKYEIASDNKKDAYQRIREIKQIYQQVLQEAQNKNLSLELVPYKLNQENLESNSQFNHSLTQNISLLVEKVGELKSHTCPKVCSEVTHQELKVAREKEIIQQLISELELGLDKDSDLTQTITKIKELIARPDNNTTELMKQLDQAQKIIRHLEQQKTPFGEKLEVIIRIDSDYLSQKWNVSSEDLKSLSVARNYQELAVARNKLFEKVVAGKNLTVSNQSKLVIPERVI